MKKNWKIILGNMRLGIVILLVFAILSSCCIWLMRIKLLQNAQEMGTYLTWNYSSEEQNNIIVYETLIELGTEYIDEQVEKGKNPKELQNWMHDLFHHVSEMFGNRSVDIYAVINDKIVAANPWFGDHEYDFKNTEWYKKAMEANGNVIFTNVYSDVITKKPVVTVAKKANHSDSLLIFDIFLEDFHTYHNPLSLPEGSSYFLCDQDGNLLFYKMDQDTEGYTEELQEYVHELLQKISDGKLDTYYDSIEDLEGKEQGVYYSVMSNGWLSVVTIPFATTLEELTEFIVTFSTIFLMLTFIIVFMAIRDYKMKSKIQYINDTIQTLGNSYYAIYRVNYQTNRYKMIKGQQDMIRKTGNKGDYTSLVYAMKEMVDENTYEDFFKSFSLENIRKLVQGNVCDFGGDYLRKFEDGVRWVHVRVLLDPILMPEEVVLCFQEVDQEKKEQLRQMQFLESALDSVKRSEKAKSIFFRNMSHDMRTPLNAIIGFCHLSEKYRNSPDKVEDYLKKIEMSGKHLLGLINDLLEIARIEQNKITLDYHQVDIRKCIRECTDLFEGNAEKEQKEFIVKFDIQDSIVMCDSFRLNQIMNNLISNAFKYTNPGDTIIVTVKQCEYQQHNKYQIIVKDTGCGMSKEFLERIFESYARETRFGPKGVIGTGLGMTIVQCLVRHMNGEITVESELSKGTTFTLTLPLEKVENVEEIKEIEDHTQEQQEEISLKGRRILLVEDDEMNIEIATEVLKMLEVDVVQARNGEEAVEQFEQSELFYFDAILMDMLMPKMNGCDATKIIRALEREDANKIPIIATTANAFAEDIAMTTEAGMNAHIAKPIDFRVLCTMLMEWIPKYRK